ncbi:MAG: hypothetical protein JST32_13970 [Bacteroidetes bacterium]|nr:hypothetical protein [Bacteroidota bacterium]
MTKLIKQGKASIPDEFHRLADWKDKTYDVKTLNIIYEFDKLINRPRLQIIFEFEQDEEKFHEESNGAISNYDSTKQYAIAKEFRKTLLENGFIGKRSIFGFLKKKKPKYKLDNVLVVYGAFKHLAKEEAIGNIPKEELKKLNEQIANTEIWHIVTGFTKVIIFFYTDEQVKAYSNDIAVRQALNNRYYQLLKPYDEFNYYDRNDYVIAFDSKENFDKNYQSNWYYYFL